MNAKLAIFFAVLVVMAGAQSQTVSNLVRSEARYHLKGNFEAMIERPLRYWPVDGDFVITNGAEFFNRPLYCVNSAFRVDAGDKPEFSCYLPGRGGNLRFGIKTTEGVKWLNDADQIVARYRPGAMIYEIKDAMLTGARVIRLEIVPLANAKGVILRAELNSVWMPVELVWAFGGANGMRGARGGDIGCEHEPVGKFFQLQAEQCRGNAFTIATNSFVLRSKSAVIEGVASTGAKLSMADARKWTNDAELFASSSATTDLPLVTGSVAMPDDQPIYLVLHEVGADTKSISAEDLPGLFDLAEEHRKAVAERVVVTTPDAFINAAAGALNIAADAIWDGASQSYMHGVVAWRTRLLGWRGAYAGDALGWHERTAAHFAGFARQQNTNAVPDKLPPADERFNLARNEAALHSNGDFSKNHYDMNLVGVDAFFRHLLWTGDLEYARQMWPAIERHFAWERRLFRREFGPDKLPLYEAYAAIWASDDLNYNGGGVAHASAYNYYHNQMAARVARFIGKDPEPYQHEADLILRAMQIYLWVAEEGTFAECKDYLGLQQVHPNGGLWTFYHTMDSEVPTSVEAWQMSRWIDTHLAHIPVRGAGVPEENLFTLPETSWMPYLWSLNNVVMAEAAHTSLGLWQANRTETAFQVFKGELLDSMYLGLCPGNLGCLTGFDVARGEAQRDFADACGINARALVEGLFGVKPDALAGELKITPGFPSGWNRASIQHPDFSFTFERDGLMDSFHVSQRFSKTMSVRLQVVALRDGVENVTVNEKAARWNWLEGIYGLPRIEIQSPPATNLVVVVKWKGGNAQIKTLPELKLRTNSLASYGLDIDWSKKLPADSRLEMIDLGSIFNDRVTQIFHNEYRSPRSPFASLALPKQGLNGWCEPEASFEVDDSGLCAVASTNGGRINLPNGVSLQTPGAAGTKNVIFTSRWNNYPAEVTVPLSGKASRAYLLMAGSTGPMQSRFDNGEVIVTYTDGTTVRLALNNPVNWWPIDQDYFLDDYAFHRDEPVPPRVDLQTGLVRVPDVKDLKGRGGKIPGGAATVLAIPLDQSKVLKSLTLKTLANEVVIGLMSVTLVR